MNNENKKPQTTNEIKQCGVESNIKKVYRDNLIVIECTIGKNTKESPIRDVLEYYSSDGTFMFRIDKFNCSTSF